MGNIGRHMRQAATTTGPAVLAGLVLCLALLNTFSGIVSGIWLAFSGEWGAIGLGFVFAFAMPLAWTIASLPSMGIAFFLFGGSATPNRALLAGGFVLALWNGVLISGWTLLIFVFFAGRVAEGTTIPLLLWGYSTTMAPLAYMASTEPPDSTGSSFALLHAMAVYALLIALYLGDASFSIVLVAVGLFAIIWAGFTMALGLSLTSVAVEQQTPF